MSLPEMLVCFGAIKEYIKYEGKVTLDGELTKKMRKRMIKRQKRHLQSLAREYRIPCVMQIVDIWRTYAKLRPIPPPPIKYLTHEENMEIVKLANRGRREFEFFFNEIEYGYVTRLQISYNRCIRYLPDETEMRLEMDTDYLSYWVYREFPQSCPYTYAKFFELPIGGKVGFSYKRHYGKCQEKWCNAKLRAWRNCRECKSIAENDIEGITYATCLECENEEHYRSLTGQRYCGWHDDVNENNYMTNVE